MNGHCSKDIITSIIYTYNHGNIFVLIFSLFREYVCLMEFFFLRDSLFFLLFLFNLFLFNDLINTCKC